MFNNERSTKPGVASGVQPVPVAVPMPQVAVQHQHPPQPYNQHATPSTLSGVIGPRMKITGDIEFEGELRVQGTVKGNINCTAGSKSTLVVDEKSEIEGDINVAVVKIGGTVKGTISSTDLLHVLNTGLIEGPVKYNAIQLDSGAVIDGTLSPSFKNVVAK